MSTLTDKLRKAGRESFLYGDLLLQAAEALEKFQPVKHGRWIVLDYPYSYFHRCTNCNWFNMYKKFDYCPNCGARMNDTDG